MIVMPYIFTIIAKRSRHFDNHNPRDYLESTTGYRRRAHAVQSNSVESIPPFAISIIIASITHAPQHRIDMMAVIFVIFRVLYGLCYVIDYPTCRSLFWLGGFIITIMLFFVH
jgi:uncharacterized MAPEG superfamily protein